MEQYIVRVNSKEYTIGFNPCSDLNSIKQICINGKTHHLDIDLDKLDSIVLDNNTHKINGIYDYDGEIVKLLIGKDYHSVEVEELRAVKKEKLCSFKCKGELVKAPMPGKVITINVKLGDKVNSGDDLLILEAMKMENRIKATTDGVVRKIHIKEDETCNARDLLIEIE